MDAVRPFRYQIAEIYHLLYEMSKDLSFDQIIRLEAGVYCQTN